MTTVFSWALITFSSHFLEAEDNSVCIWKEIQEALQDQMRRRRRMVSLQRKLQAAVGRAPDSSV